MKRSAEIALVLMGATAVGTTSYALMPRDCRPPNNPPAQQAVAAPGAAQPNQDCRRRWSSGYSSGSRWGSTWRSSSRSTAVAATTSVARSSVPTHSSGTVSVARGGFGSTGHAVSGGS